MFRMYASNSHSYTHLILALGIVREPTLWRFIASKYPGTHDNGLPSDPSGNVPGVILIRNCQGIVINYTVRAGSRSSTISTV